MRGRLLFAFALDAHCTSTIINHTLLKAFNRLASHYRFASAAAHGGRHAAMYYACAFMSFPALKSHLNLLGFPCYAHTWIQQRASNYALTPTYVWHICARGAACITKAIRTDQDINQHTSFPYYQATCEP